MAYLPILAKREITPCRSSDRKAAPFSIALAFRKLTRHGLLSCTFTTSGRNGIDLGAFPIIKVGQESKASLSVAKRQVDQTGAERVRSGDDPTAGNECPDFLVHLANGVSGRAVKEAQPKAGPHVRRRPKRKERFDRPLRGNNFSVDTEQAATLQNYRDEEEGHQESPSPV
jgi:hypothetical protein